MAVSEWLNTLKVLSLSTTRVQKRTLSEASDGLVKAIAELALNALFNKAVQIPSQQLRQLRKHWKVLHNLSDSKISWVKKRGLIKRKGFQFIATLLKVTLPHVGGVRNKQQSSHDTGTSGGMEPPAANMQQLHMRQQKFYHTNTGESTTAANPASKCCNGATPAASHSRSTHSRKHRGTAIAKHN